MKEAEENKMKQLEKGEFKDDVVEKDIEEEDDKEEEDEVVKKDEDGGGGNGIEELEDKKPEAGPNAEE